MWKIIKKFCEEIASTKFLLSVFAILLLFPIDLFNWDNFLYSLLCLNLKTVGIGTVCSHYFDIPVWEVLTAIGTISAGFFAFEALEKTRMQKVQDQTPMLISHAINMPGGDCLQLRNIGQGNALFVFVSTDEEGSKVITKKEIPPIYYILPNGEYQNISINHIQRSKSETRLFIHYQDSFKNKYYTTSLFKRTKVRNGGFNCNCRDNEIYQNGRRLL